jgi:YfiH family protein
MSGHDPVSEVMGRWTSLQSDLSTVAIRMVIARQVHGNRVWVHGGGWEGWLRVGHADGHFTRERATALAVTIADCIPVFLAHPSGAVAILHAGWRGVVARIGDEGIRQFGRAELPPDEIRAHLGPAICGRCYEVSADVRSQLTGMPANRSGHVDIRSIVADQLSAAGVREVTVSPFCTRCDNDRFYSHRAGDSGRQVAVIAAGS